MKQSVLGFFIILGSISAHAQFAPPAGEEGTEAIWKDSTIIVNWATGYEDVELGPQDIADPDSELVSFGTPEETLGSAEGSSTNVLSLGDGGSIVLTFDQPIRNGEGPDFVVFENGISDDFLELAHVEVSSDGVNFLRFPSESNTQTDEQIEAFGSIDATEIDNLAGKYRQGYGTPFDLSDLGEVEDIDLDNITHVRIIDVVGSIDPEWGTMTTGSASNLINDPYPTAFESGGFDLDAVGVIHDATTTSISTQERVKGSIYPNPSNGTVNITVEGTIRSICIVDLSGKVLSIGSLSETQVVFRNLADGMYVIQVVLESDAVLTEKVLLRRD